MELVPKRRRCVFDTLLLILENVVPHTPTLKLLESWIARVASPEAQSWLRERLAEVGAGQERTLFLSFGMVPRKLGKADLELTPTDLAAAADARSGWDPAGWSIDQAARALLVLRFPSDNAAAYTATLDKLFSAGEVGELVALYQALPLLPHPHAHVLRAAEGVRTNMKAVFCAVAHRNPYPAEQFDQGQWNQMVLKCLFIGVPLDPVIGLDERSNPALAGMLLDYAHERWAAGRKVSPELWRPLAKHLTGPALADLQKVLEQGELLERQAAALTLAQSDKEEAKKLLVRHEELAEQVEQGRITWSQIAAEHSA